MYGYLNNIKSVSLQHTIILLTITALFLPYSIYCQTGPGGVGKDDGTSTLELWLKADAGVEEAAADDAELGDNVEFWRDQSGNNNDMQNDYGGNPVFNQSSGNYLVDFSSGSVYLRGNSVITGTTARMMFIVIRPTSLVGGTSNNCCLGLAPNASAGAG